MTAAADLGGVTARVASRVSSPRPAAPGSAAARRRASLSLVAPLRGDVSRVPFVAVLVSLLVAGLLGLLMLNTVLAQGSFALYTLRDDARVLADREQALLREVEALRSPATLAEKAAGLGMVPGGQPAFLRLPDGAILGADIPAELPVDVLAEGEAPAGAGATADEADTSGTTDEAATADAESADESATTDTDGDAAAYGGEATDGETGDGDSAETDSE